MLWKVQEIRNSVGGHCQFLVFYLWRFFVIFLLGGLLLSRYIVFIFRGSMVLFLQNAHSMVSQFPLLERN